MPTFTMNYWEESYGHCIFDADSLEHAQELRRQVIEGEITLDDLPDFYNKHRGGNETFEEVEEIIE